MVCLGCGVKEDALAWLQEASKPQSPERGNFWRGNVEARKVLIFSRWDPYDEQSRVFSQQEDEWIPEWKIKDEIDETLKRALLVIQNKETLKVTIEVVEDD
jgi:hypothetical protein